MADLAKASDKKIFLFAIIFIFIAIAAVTGGIVGLSLDLYPGGVVPHTYESRFVQACGNLNGEELAFSSIKNLHGFCRIHHEGNGFTMIPCSEAHILSYINRLKSCGDDLPEVEKLVKMPYSSNMADKYSCLNQQYEVGELAQVLDGSTYIYQRDNLSTTDNSSWVCKVSSDSLKIRAVPFFWYE